MGFFSKSWTLAIASLGILTFSQAPEFSQQYKQRLGGGINELASVVNQFEKDAAEQGLSREEALDALNNSSEEFPRTRGKSMALVFQRYKNLLVQRKLMEEASSVVQPFYLLRSPDSDTFSGTLNAYKPGLQLTLEGITWALLGGGLLGGLGRAPITVYRYRARKKREPKVDRTQKSYMSGHAEKGNHPASQQIADETADTIRF